MLKHLTLCAALLGFATSPVVAQQQEAVLKRMEVTGADFDIVLAMPKSPPQQIYDLSESPEALLVRLIGGELVLSFDGEQEMLKALDSLRLPACAFHTGSRNGTSRRPVAVYIVPRDE